MSNQISDLVAFKVLLQFGTFVLNSAAPGEGLSLTFVFGTSSSLQTGCTIYYICIQYLGTLLVLDVPQIGRRSSEGINPQGQGRGTSSWSLCGQVSSHQVDRCPRDLG